MKKSGGGVAKARTTNEEGTARSTFSRIRSGRWQVRGAPTSKEPTGRINLSVSTVILDSIIYEQRTELNQASN